MLKYLLVCHLVGLIGGLATASQVRTWYPTLRKPDWTPPNWVFGPVWTLLYTCMAIAGARVGHDSTAFFWFCLQLCLNCLWSPIFFLGRQPGWALADIAALWCTLAVCVPVFQALDPLAAALFLPYWLWVSFATLLNFEIWRRNRAQP